MTLKWPCCIHKTLCAYVCHRSQIVHVFKLLSYVSQDSRLMLLHVWDWNLGKCMYMYMQM